MDTNFHLAVQQVVEEPIPYFRQFTAEHKLSEAVPPSTDRHAYASTLEEMPGRRGVDSAPPCPLPTGPCPPIFSEGSEGGTPVSLPVVDVGELTQSLDSPTAELDPTELNEKIKQ